MRGIVAGVNVLTVEAWNDLDYVEKCARLARLSDLDVKAQASLFAVAGKKDVRQVVNAWVALGYLPAERIAAVIAAEPNHSRGGATHA